MRGPMLRFLASTVAAAATLFASSARSSPPGDVGQAATIYVPGALAGTNPQIWTPIWVMNNGSTSATVRLLTKWDTLGEHDLSLVDPVTFAAGDATYLYQHTFPDPGLGVQFLALSVPPGLVIRPVLHRTNAGDSAGDLTLPVFTSLVPANTKSVAGNFRSSWAECQPSAAPRRLNVTLFNPSDVPANFRVTVAFRSNGITTGPPDTESRRDFDYVVLPRSVRQINAVPYEPSLFCAGYQWGMGWVEVTADQPYLAYASTVREDGTGILPYEVFPALTGQ